MYLRPVSAFEDVFCPLGKEEKLLTYTSDSEKLQTKPEVLVRTWNQDCCARDQGHGHFFFPLKWGQITQYQPIACAELPVRGHINDAVKQMLAANRDKVWTGMGMPFNQISK